MKRKPFIIAISLLVILITLISSCGTQLQVPSGSDTTQVGTSEERIKELEAQIITLMQSQQLSDNERKQELSKLKAEIEKLKKTETEQATQAATEAQKTISYTVEDGKAIITSININEESVTIPAVIDGYQVSAIGNDVISSQTLKKVIISSGIEKIDWFAFRNCSSLSHISIPDSIVSIGYGAFDNTSRSLTIICNRNSFAHKYAQSYGITYDIT